MPLGLPHHWSDETTVLPAAVRAFIAWGARQGPEPDRLQMLLVRVYLEHYINAGCWEPVGEELAALQVEIKRLTTPEELRGWVDRCMELGIDPL